MPAGKTKAKSKLLATAAPRVRRHHLDRRADQIAAVAPGADDELLNTTAVAVWLGCSTQWLEIGRSKGPTGGYGPRFTRVSERCIRYKRGDVLAWLKKRTFNSTAEYSKAVSS